MGATNRRTSPSEPAVADTPVSGRNERDLYRAVIETVEAAIFIYQGNELVDVNPAAERIAGRSREELLQISFWDVAHPVDAAMVRERGLARLQGERPPAEYQVRILQPTGEVRWVEYRARPIVFRGQPAVLGVAIDVTEAKQTAERLRQNQEELAHVQRVATAEAFAAGLAHELQQPLAAMATMAGAALRRLRAGEIDPSRLIETFEETGRLSLHAGDLVRRIHEFTHKRVRPPERVDPSALVDSATELFSREDRYRLHSHVPAHLPEIQGDVVQLRQVIVNLIQNALDAGRELESDRWDVDLRGRHEENEVILTVLDRGAGIDGEDADKVFDAFSSTKATGMGLGLAICRSITEAHDGRLWFAKREGGGTEFNLSLPAASRPGRARTR